MTYHVKYDSIAFLVSPRYPTNRKLHLRCNLSNYRKSDTQSLSFEDGGGDKFITISVVFQCILLDLDPIAVRLVLY